MRQYGFSNRYRQYALGSALFFSLGVVGTAGACGPGVIKNNVMTGDGGSGSGSGSSSGDAAAGSGGGKCSQGFAFVESYTSDQAMADQTQAKILVSGLDLTQQANLMRGTLSGCPSPQFGDIFRTVGIPGTIEGWKFRDGPRGVCLAANLPTGQQGYSTAFPVASGRGATWDMDLEEKVGEAMGDEMVASSHSMILAPVVNILRHPAWGRSQETYGEDSYLLGRMGTAYTIGAQKYVAACVKHFAANNIELNRNSSVSLMDEQTLHEIYGRQFEMVIQDGGAACVMAAYNLIQTSDSGMPAQHCTSSKELLTDVLRTQFGFKGFVLSDWWAVPGGVANCGIKANTEQANTVDAVNAGLDMELPWDFNFSQLESVVNGGQLPRQQLIESGTRIVAQQVRFKEATSIQGLRPATTKLNTTTGSIDNNADHIALAQKAALESMVLLKNEKNTLPIPKTVKNVAVIGATVPFTLTNADITHGSINFAKDVRLGDLGSSRVFADPMTSVGPFEGIKAAAGSGVNVTMGSDENAAANADFIVLVAGLTPTDEGEEYTGAADRFSFSLDDKNINQFVHMPVQDPLIAKVAALGKPMVVVLEGGSVIEMPWLSTVPAVVMAWYPGQAGGAALGQLLFGQANFSGKLPVTWPNPVAGAHFGDEPPFSPGGKVKMDYFLGYRYYEKMGIKPLFPFGHGLSYTTFKYENLQLPSGCTAVGKNDIVDVKVDVTNMGASDGDEVSFLFVSYPNTKAMRRSIKELKGFTRTAAIKAGMKQTVTIPLRIQDLKYWDSANSNWVVESGAVQLMVGGSSAASATPITGTLTIN